ncbi:MAG TPA: cysteine desulfurase family protein [Polyangiaceae bacterium]|jgi:cysteine desulfurase|nr:cysteine desulfurase family protein [Polyangiaceae bacterium]
MRRVYLDWNATTPPLPEVVQAMADAAREAWGNPSSVHAFGRAARARVEDAREAVARLAGSDPRDVVLTSGGTEANNLALRSAFAEAGGVLVTSRLEHPSVAKVAEALEREGKTRVRWLRVLPGGAVDVEDLARALAEGDVRLVALQAVNAETGVLQPVREAIAMAHRAGARVHVDTVQSFGRADDVAEQADSRSLAAHKMRGPKSIGALITRPALPVAPVLLGGSQERGVRPGTVDPVAAAGLAVAARRAASSPARWAALAPLRDTLEAGLLRAATGGARVNGSGAARAPHVTSVAFRGWSSPELVAALDLEGVAASGGSACSAGTAAPSTVLSAMGDDDAATSTLRFSLGEETTADDVAVALEAAARVLAR